MLSLSLTTDPVESNSESLSDALSMPPQPRYFHTLNAYGTSLVLFGGMGRVPGDEDEENGNDGSIKDEGAADQSSGRLEALNDLYVFDIISNDGNESIRL